MGLRLIDLSVPIESGAVSEPAPPDIRYYTHDAGGLAWIKRTFGVAEEDLVYSNGLGAAFEEVRAITHTATHMDAPWHYGPVSGGEPAKTIDQVPLEWCYGDGVRLDLRRKAPGEFITVGDLQAALAAIGYRLRPLDIVLLWTGCDERMDSRVYFDQPGMGRESTLWLVEQGIRVIGIDAYGFDRKFEDMAEDYRRTGDGRYVWPAHFVGITRKYCQIEKLANLGSLPRPHGFKVACFPVKVARASAGWVRPVAFVEE